MIVKSSPQGRTPVMLATRCGETAMLELLLEESAPNLELADKAGDTVLHYSCSKGKDTCEHFREGWRKE